MVAGFLNSLLRHADVVKIANLAQIVNVIAPILTRGEEMLIQSTFYPFEMFCGRREGVSLRPALSGPTYESASYGPAGFIDASAILNDDRLSVFATNRSLSDPAPVTIRLADRRIASLEGAELLTGPDAKAANSFEQPELIRSQPFADVEVAGGIARATLPPLSLAAMTCQLA